MRTFLRLTMALSVVVSACSFKPLSEKDFNIKVQIPKELATSFLQHISGPMYDCFVVNVSGPGIAPFDGNAFQIGDGTSMPGYCTYPGITSRMMAPWETETTLKVPTGVARTFQLIGIHTGQGCPLDRSFAEVMGWLKQNGTGYIEEMGRTTVDLFNSTRIELRKNTMPQGFAFGCSAKLNLVAGVFLETGNYDFTDSLPSSFPPNVTGLVKFNADTLRSLSDPNSTVPMSYDATTTSKYARMDFLFDVSGFNIWHFDEIRLRAEVEGGSRLCSSQSSLTGNLEVRIYNPTVGGWTSTSGVGPGPSLDWAVGAALRPADALMAVQGSSTSDSSGNFIVLSMRSQSQSNVTTCSNLTLKHVAAYLSRKFNY